MCFIQNVVSDSITYMQQMLKSNMADGRNLYVLVYQITYKFHYIAARMKFNICLLFDLRQLGYLWNI